MEQKSDLGGEMLHCGLLFYCSNVKRNKAFTLVVQREEGSYAASTEIFAIFAG